MEHTIIHDNQGQAWARVTKPTARKAFNAGKMVTFCPVKLFPFGPWNPSVTRAGASDFSDFDHLHNEFKHYNCSSEAGNYVAYYIHA